MTAERQRLELLTEDLQQQCLLWKIYQANELLQFAYGTLLKFVLDRLAINPLGLSLGDLLADCLDALANEEPWPTNWSAFVGATKPAANAATDESGGEKGFLFDARRTEGSCGGAEAWDALRVIAIVSQRMEPHSEAIRNAFRHLDPAFFHSLATELPYVAGLTEPMFLQSVQRLLRERVIDRHLWVAQRKFVRQHDYTFLLEMDEGRARARHAMQPVFTNPRLGSALWFLYDLALIDEEGLTAAGRRMLA